MLDFAALGIGALLALALLPVLLIALAVPYVVLRQRCTDPPDEKLGSLIGLQFFVSLGIVLALAGASTITYDLFTHDLKAPAAPPNQFGRPAPAVVKDPDQFTPAIRAGIGIVLSGVMLAVLHALLANLYSGSPHVSRVQKTFLGWRFAVHGVVVTFIVTMLTIFCLQRDAFDDEANKKNIYGMMAILLVWLPSWVVHFSLLRVASKSVAKKPIRSAEVESES